MLKVGLVGFGGLGHVHAASLWGFEDAKITAICDIDPEQFKKQDVEINFAVDANPFDITTCNTYECYKEMLEKEEFDIMVVALPTDLHADYSIMALEKGINVICEKPMALTVADCKRMVEARDKSGKELMIAQCIRFWPEYEYLEECIKTNKYGKLNSMIMERVGSYPYSEWFLDHKRSGGALIDLHVHDMDWANYIFGSDPDTMSAEGLIGKTGGIDECNVLMKYEDTLVSIRGSWMLKGTFSMAFQANFEEATLQLDWSKDPTITIYKDNEEPTTYDSGKESAYAREMRYFIDTVKGLHKNEKCTAETSMMSIDLVLREAELITM